MIAVRFTRAMAPYNAGETAGFDEGRVARLEKLGYATRVHGAAPATPKAAPPAAAAPVALPEPPAAATAAVVPPSGPPASRRG